MSEKNLSATKEAANHKQSVDALLAQIESIRHEDYQRVLELAENAHQIALEDSYWSGVTKSLYHMADSYLRLGNYAKASAPAQQALITARTHGLAIEEAYALSALGAVYAYLGDESEATDLFFQQLTIAEAYNHLTLMGYAYGDLGSMYLRTDAWKQGLELIDKCNQIFDSLQREEEKYIWYFDIGNFYNTRGEFEKAYEMFESMYRLGTLKNITEAKILGQTGMAKAKADLNDYAIAHTCIDHALSIIQASNSSLKCEVFLERGKIYTRQNHYEAAIITLTNTLELATQTQHWKVLLEARQMLCELYEKTGDYQQALIHNRAYHEARDKAFNDRSNARSQTLQTLYEIETVRKEAEINQLRLQAAEHELEEYKQAEAKRLEMERLKVTLAGERELVEIKERILTRISHEFRTPLAIIRTSMDILTRYANRLSEEKRQTYQGKIDEQFKAIEKLLNDIGIVLRADKGQIPKSKEAISLSHICRLAIRNAQTQTNSSQRIQMTIEANPDAIWIERDILLEILTHLLTNALKFSTGIVEMQVQTQSDRITIRVADTGIGIPTDEQEKVFESLYRASNNDEVPGNGLGLTIVRDYLSLIGGTIKLQSALNDGTTALITIPVTSQIPEAD
ncbi:MAG: HAMP domain-containing histidine kinase [Chloroflexi bacterium]|nr:HAMP domain-containing histidine kinase [Chloroflexota bacterium]MCC6895148.1 HAMP domain-containing histidine kinase [Anaerolineae bacterium]